MKTERREPRGCVAENRDVLVWRRRQLTRAGFGVRQATALARDDRTDIHALIDLVERGCPPELAARILDPIEEDHTP